MRWFSSIDKHLEKVPKWLDKMVGLIAKMTLEIYLVQYVLINVIRELDLFFPLNWIILTASIAVAAIVLHTVMEFIIKIVKKGIGKMKKNMDG